jgi:hypothetical protein
MIKNAVSDAAKIAPKPIADRAINESEATAPPNTVAIVLCFPYFKPWDRHSSAEGPGKEIKAVIMLT